MKNNIEKIWNDKKRYFGMPISFTKYYISEDRLFIESGFLNIKVEEILLYRIKDISLELKLGQRIFGCGCIHIKSSDKTNPDVIIKNIKNPIDVKELIHKAVEDAKNQKHVILSEDSCDHNIEN